MLEKSYTRHVTDVYKKAGSKFRDGSQKSIQDALFPKKTKKNEDFIHNEENSTDGADDKKLSDQTLLTETCYKLLTKMSENLEKLAGNEITRPNPADEQLPRIKNYENMKLTEDL